jgi:hypothetical protein
MLQNTNTKYKIQISSQTMGIGSYRKNEGGEEEEEEEEETTTTTTTSSSTTTTTTTKRSLEFTANLCYIL